MRVLAALLVVLGAVAAAFPQDEQPGQNYRLQEEDEVLIIIAEDENYNLRAPIGPDGYIEYPNVGRLQLKGKTLAEVKEEVRRILIDRQIFVDPTVTVNVQNYRKPQATVLGQDTVNRPGPYPFRPGQRLRDLIGAAGGTVPGAADLRHCVLSRVGSNEQIPIDLYSLIEEQRDDQNFELRDGDVLTVPRDEQGFVNVTGFVYRSGALSYREGMRLSDAIAGAQGVVPDVAWTSRIQIRRKDPYNPAKTTEMTVDLNKAQRDLNKDILLQRGDSIYVPRNDNFNVNRFRDYVNAAYIFTILLRSDPFDAISDALR